jgi:hypothetical protein
MAQGEVLTDFDGKAAAQGIEEVDAGRGMGASNRAD